jgi:hypothetical protein
MKPFVKLFLSLMVVFGVVMLVGMFLHLIDVKPLGEILGFAGYGLLYPCLAGTMIFDRDKKKHNEKTRRSDQQTEEA